MVEKETIKDEVIIDHYIAKTGKHIIHKCNSSLKHKLLKMLGLAHNSITATGMQDTTAALNGTSVTYAYLGIGEGTTGDAVGDTAMQNTTHGLIRAVAPTRWAYAQANDTLQWTHVFSKANDASLTGFTSAINEVGVTTAASTYHLLLHIAGGTNYGPVDSCNWDALDTLTITVNCQIKQGS